MLSIHCPNCGGTNIFDETKNIPTYCGFCSAHLPDMTEFVKGSLNVEVDKKQLQVDEQRTKLYERRMKAANKPDIGLIIFGVILLIVVIVVFGFFGKIINLFG